jgi:hypothetical protein
MAHEIPFIDHEMSEGVQIQIPPRINFLLKHDKRDVPNALYGVDDVINILTYNGMEHQIPELFFILGENASYIKKKIETRDAEFRKRYSLHFKIIDRMVDLKKAKGVDIVRLKRVMTTRGRYDITDTISIENLLSYRLGRTILVKLKPFVKDIMTFINEKREEIKTFTEDDDYEKVRRIKDEIEGMIDSFYSNIIFKLPRDEQNEYLCICFRDTYESDGIDHYITNIVVGLIQRYNDYYHSLRIMMVEDIRRPYFKKLKEGTILYRGYQTPTDPTHRRHLIPPGRPFVFFTPNPFVALGYAIPSDISNDLGKIAVYQTSRRLKLLDFSNYRTLDYIHALLNELGAPRNVIDSLLTGWFGWKDFGTKDFKGPSPRSREKTFERMSDEGVDIPVVKWICSQGFNGYVALNVDGLGDEIVLCDPVPIDETNPKKITSIGVLDKSVINYPLPSSQKEWYENILN